ncbi:immunoglobulin-like domain-containing protein [Pseudoalteromonas sp. T1lg65]|uniref:immunoglobulin-like domain-containing protein n=1 Tax=Pseudoalteromonas sp. T1lg65 TaxID=2077101 RepID=UPI003F796C72
MIDNKKAVILLSVLMTLTACGGGSSKKAIINDTSEVPRTNDIKAPIITLQGDNPMTLEFGTTYADPGASAEDDIDDSVTVSIENNINAFALGEYEVIYTAKDKAGNASEATRIVKVIDTTPPEITLNGEQQLELAQWRDFQDPGVEAKDAADGIVSVSTSGNLDNTKVGVYELTYKATDKSGNTATATRTVKVLENPSLVDVLADQNLLLCAKEAGYEYVLDVVELSCNNKRVQSTQGINQLVELRVLDLSRNEIQETNLTGNPLLTKVDFSDNLLTELDIKNNLELSSLIADNNKLSAIDVTHNEKLVGIALRYNRLTEIDVSANQQLVLLMLQGNALTQLDVGNNTKLQFLNAGRNQLTTINLNSNPDLKTVFVADNQLTSLDLTNLSQLSSLNAGDNQLANIDVSQNEELDLLALKNNQLTSINVANNIALGLLDLRSNQLTSLDVSSNTTLYKLQIEGNQITELDLSNNTGITTLTLDENVVCTGEKCAISTKI